MVNRMLTRLAPLKNATCGQCSSKPACVSAQSDLIVTVSAYLKKYDCIVLSAGGVARRLIGSYTFRIRPVTHFVRGAERAKRIFSTVILMTTVTVRGHGLLERLSTLR